MQTLHWNAKLERVKGVFDVLGELLLAEPNNLALQAPIQFGTACFGSIDEDLAHGFGLPSPSCRFRGFFSALFALDSSFLMLSTVGSSSGMVPPSSLMV
jgi:hypothetical protein